LRLARSPPKYQRKRNDAGWSRWVHNKLNQCFLQVAAACSGNAAT
jgi:hypothetical protein